jgi:hypothetical protein
MNPTSKKFIALFLAFSLLMINCATFSRLEEKREERKKHGANLIIQKINGQQIEGELITVKPNSLLLLDRKSGADVSVDIADIKVIRIVKKSKVLEGAGLGLLICGGIGALGGFAMGDTTHRGWYGSTYKSTRSEEALGFGIMFGFIGLSIGALLGSSAGKDEAIPIEGKPPAFIEFNLEKLRKKARIRDYR